MKMDTNNQIKIKSFLLTLMIFHFCFDALIYAGGEEKLSIEIRAAAHPVIDKKTVDTAKSMSANEIYENESLTAKWFPVFNTQKTDLSGDPNLVTREKEDGNIELLVLIGTEDVTEKDIQEIRRGTNYLTGRLALDVKLNDVGGKKLRELSRSCLVQRYLAQIINGQVYRALPVVTILGRDFQIPGDFTGTDIQQIAKLSGDKFTEEYTRPPNAITITPFRLFIFLIFLLLLIFSVFPADGLKKSNHPKMWIIISALIFALLGGYLFGISKSTGKQICNPAIPPWADVININIAGIALGVFIGSSFGIIAGFVLRFIVRRGLHNISRALKFISRKAGHPEFSSTSTSKIFLRSFNRKQKAVILLCIFLLSVFVIFPPWIGCREMIINKKNPAGAADSEWEFMGFHYILSSESFFIQTPYLIHRINYTFLFVIIGTIAAGGYAATRLLREK